MPATARKRFGVPPSWPALPSNNATRVSNIGMHGEGRTDHLLWHPVTYSPFSNRVIQVKRRVGG
jgi:hypothetical protein